MGRGERARPARSRPPQPPPHHRQRRSGPCRDDERSLLKTVGRASRLRAGRLAPGYAGHPFRERGGWPFHHRDEHPVHRCDEHSPRRRGVSRARPNADPLRHRGAVPADPALPTDVRPQRSPQLRRRGGVRSVPHRVADAQRRPTRHFVADGRRRGHLDPVAAAAGPTAVDLGRRAAAETRFPTRRDRSCCHPTTARNGSS